MDRFQAMETFTRVVECGSFKRAAETLRVLPSTVTKTIKDLEADLGVQLLSRTTRSIQITDAGLRYYDSCKAILREVEAARDAIAGQGGTIRGAIRVGTTPSLARRFLIPALSRFTDRYPSIDIDFHLSDAVADLIQERIDCVIRAGEPRPSSLIMRRLVRFHWYVCASPAYIELHGAPQSLADLGDHRAVGYISSRTGRTTNWTFPQGKELATIAMRSSVTVNDTDAYIAAGLAGLGLIRAASYLLNDHIAEGRLIRVLTDIVAATDPLSVLYPQSRHLSPAVRAFIDWCTEIFAAEAADL
jgi:LysR family transcriptional regulator for bpeEF and oprC